ncbi:MAG: EAL domain-containing protein [Phycisphaerales bacterium]|nr:EAL domain-containing protein [Phycisphaerales bacterium]
MTAEFADWVTYTARELALPAGSLRIEVTETAAMRGGSTTRTLLADLRTAGIPILLDDFGSGFTMFQQLRDLPLSAVKIDGSVVKSALSSEPDRRLLEALASLAHALGLQVIAEHVEDERAADVVGSAGADLAQGYLFGRPAEIVGRAFDSNPPVLAAAGVLDCPRHPNSFWYRRLAAAVVRRESKPNSVTRRHSLSQGHMRYHSKSNTVNVAAGTTRR